MDMSAQLIISAERGYEELDTFLIQNGISGIFLVCGASIQKLKLNNYFMELPDRLHISVVRFSDFAPNPSYESVEKGVLLFQSAPCDLIVAVGGGSAMDVAKCIKLYANMDGAGKYLEQEIIPNDIKLLAVPTTAGTGSEATRFAVIYDRGEKQSVSHESCIPMAVLFDAAVLKSLPEYHRKATMLDALCHGIEAYWSVNATDESKIFSRKAIRMILSYMEAYLANDETGNRKMLEAANLAGKAINITQTTAGHALCYKLTGLYGIAHGHAAALCVAAIWEYMISHVEDCIDSRGSEYLRTTFQDLAEIVGCETMEESVLFFHELLKKLDISVPVAREDDYRILRNGVNAERLKNNPVRLTEPVIDMLYHQILA